MIGTAGLAAGLVLIGLVPSLGWLLPVSALTGTANGVVSVLMSVLVAADTAPYERGRVAAVIGAVTAGGQLTAYATGCVLIAHLGARPVVVLGGAVGLVAPALLGRAC